MRQLSTEFTERCSKAQPIDESAKRKTALTGSHESARSQEGEFRDQGEFSISRREFSEANKNSRRDA
jgi:hypothetical protein